MIDSGRNHREGFVASHMDVSSWSIQMSSWRLIAPIVFFYIFFKDISLLVSFIWL